jgi:serine/threonine-protein kinase HipA
MNRDHRCLACYLPLDEEGDYHAACSRRIFGSPEPPELPLDLADMVEGATRVVVGRIALTGVQAKLSLDIERIAPRSSHRRFTIVGAKGVWGEYILKPPSKLYTQLPENEDLMMHLAKIADIETAQHTLIRLHSGEFAYITRRFDRIGTHRSHVKLAMEDMCQLTERLTESKYKGSYEQIGKAIDKYSNSPGLDAMSFYRTVLFCYLIGNADMHLKNFSLLTKKGLVGLSPAYDLVSTDLVLDDPEETALTINGKKNKLRSSDWQSLGRYLDIPSPQVNSINEALQSSIPEMKECIDRSFLEAPMRERLVELIEQRAEKRFRSEK